jgi:purine nucleoside phosphorylase
MKGSLINAVQHSARPCRQVCVWADWGAEDACSLVGGTSTVSHVHHNFASMGVDKASFYEGHTMDLVTFATRVCKVLGVETMIGMLVLRRLSRRNLTIGVVTNAAGGLNQTYRVGDIVCLNDVRCTTENRQVLSTDAHSISTSLD